MKNLLAQIAFAIAVFIALATTSCSGSMNGADTSIDDNSKDKQTALQRLNVQQEGIEKDKHNIYSTHCWMSLARIVGHTFAEQAAQQQLVKACPNSRTTINGTEQQSTRVGMYTCTLITIPKEGLNCK